MFRNHPSRRSRSEVDLVFRMICATGDIKQIVGFVEENQVGRPKNGFLPRFVSAERKRQSLPGSMRQDRGRLVGELFLIERLRGFRMRDPEHMPPSILATRKAVIIHGLTNCAAFSLVTRAVGSVIFFGVDSLFKILTAVSMASLPQFG